MSAEIGKQILEAVKAYVTAQVAPLRTALSEVQRAVEVHPPPPKQGERGEPGLPGEKGEPGPKGDAPSEDELRAIIAPLIPQPSSTIS